MGEYFELFKDSNGGYLCPICGEAEFKEPPYDSKGNPSFQTSSCGFEFGFDDSSLASAEAVEGLNPNWDRWRLKVVEKNRHSSAKLQALENQLNQIGYRLAYDLIPVKIESDT